MASDATPDHPAQQDNAGSSGGGPIKVAFVEATALGLSGLVRAGGRGLPERIGAADLALIGVATHKCARMLTKDPVTSPLRPRATWLVASVLAALTVADFCNSPMPRRRKRHLPDVR
jgi:hypothetical protein